MKLRYFIPLNILLSLVVALIIAEAVFGSWRSDPPFSRLNLMTNRTYFQNIGKLYPTEKKVVRYSRDKYGFRGHYDGVGGIEILTMGGSTTDQRYLDEGDTWQDQLSAAFERDGLPIDVVNAGVDGHSSAGHLKSFDLWLKRIPGLRVKYILFYIGINDLYTIGENSFDRSLSVKKSEGWSERLIEKSVTIHIVKTLWGMVRAKYIYDLAHHRIDFTQKKWTEKPYETDHQKIIAGYEPVYRERLRALDRMTRELGGKPIFVTQMRALFKSPAGVVLCPTDIRRLGPYLINGVDEYLLLKALNRVTMDECRSLGGICLDMVSEIELPLADYYDHYHTNPAGARTMAEYLHDKLKGFISSGSSADQKLK